MVIVLVGQHQMLYFVMTNIYNQMIENKYPKIDAILNDYYKTKSSPTKDLHAVILEKIANPNNYKKYWTDGVLKTISNSIGHQVYGRTVGFVPNYGGSIEFLTDLGNDKKAITQIHFYVSLLNDVYTIQINEIEEQIQKIEMLDKFMPVQKLKEIWVSPSNHRYADLFLKIESILEETLHKPIFLPYSVQKMELNGIQIPNVHNNTVYVEDAFFKKILPLNQDYIIKGNPKYRISELN